MAEQIGALFRNSAEAARHYHRSALHYVPRPGRGVRKALYESPHTANLVMAIIGGPPVKSVESIQTLGGMSFVSAECDDPDPDFGPIARDSSLTFSGQMAHIIDKIRIMRAAGLGEVWASMMHNIVVEVTVSPFHKAKIVFSYEKNGVKWHLTINYEGRQPALGLAQAPSFFYAETRVIGGPVLDALGSILLDAQIANAAQPGLLDPSGGEVPARDENADVLPKTSAFASDRSSDKGTTHPHDSNGASTIPNMLRVCEFVIPESLDGRAFPQPSRPNGGSDDKSYHAYSVNRFAHV